MTMEYTEFNQASYAVQTRVIHVYQVVDDFGDLIGWHGVRPTTQAEYRSSWAFFANGG